MDEERWKNIEIRILFPMPTDDFVLVEDPRFTELVDEVLARYPDAVMSGREAWSDEPLSP